MKINIKSAVLNKMKSIYSKQHSSEKNKSPFQSPFKNKN